MVLYMALDKDSLKIYELFGNPHPKYGDNQNYFALHTLDRLYLNFKDAKDLKTIKPFLSSYTIYPYLMFQNLENGKESEIIKLIFNDINTNLFPEKNFNKDIIRKVEYPSVDFPFMKNLLNVITSERKRK